MRISCRQTFRTPWTWKFASHTRRSRHDQWDPDDLSLIGELLPYLVWLQRNRRDGTDRPPAGPWWIGDK